MVVPLKKRKKMRNLASSKKEQDIKNIYKKIPDQQKKNYQIAK